MRNPSGTDVAVSISNPKTLEFQVSWLARFLHRGYLNDDYLKGGTDNAAFRASQNDQLQQEYATAIKVV